MDGGLDDLVEQLKATIREYGLISDYSSNEQLEKEAWRWVLLEFMGYDRSTGLEGLGLLGFIPEIPWTWQSVPAFERYWGFDKEELARVIMVLLDTIRRNGAVCFPDALPPSDDFLLLEIENFISRMERQYPDPYIAGLQLARVEIIRGWIT